VHLNGFKSGNTFSAGLSLVPIIRRSAQLLDNMTEEWTENIGSACVRGTLERHPQLIQNEKAFAITMTNNDRFGNRTGNDCTP